MERELTEFIMPMGFQKEINSVRRKFLIIIPLVIMLLAGCNGSVNTAYEVFDNCQHWTAEEMDIFFDYHSKYLDYENAKSVMTGQIHTENGDILFFVHYDSSSQLVFVPMGELKYEYAYGKFIQAPDDYTYIIEINRSRIEEILPNGTVLTFRRKDITEGELFIPEELGELKQEVITRSTADEMDIFFDTYPKYRRYENSSTDMVGRVRTESGTVYFCAEYSHEYEYDLYFYFLDRANAEIAIGRRAGASDHRTYTVEIECSKIPDILPDGTILTFRREEIPVEEMLMPEELGELKQENAEKAQE